jgi:hypothetical protein
MSKRIHVRLHELPERSVTTVALHALDFIVPGEWENFTDFRALVQDVTGETEKEIQNAIARNAVALYDNEDESYQTAMRLYELVDTVDKLASAVAVANKFGENFDFANVLERYTPKADTVQAHRRGAQADRGDRGLLYDEWVAAGWFLVVHRQPLGLRVGVEDAPGGVDRV